MVGGHVPMMIEAILSLLQLVKGGSVRAVAVTSKKRSVLAPEIPTMTELGMVESVVIRDDGQVAVGVLLTA